MSYLVLSLVLHVQRVRCDREATIYASTADSSSLPALNT